MSAARVTAGFAEGVQLFERDAGEACFLEEFSGDGVVKVFVNTDKAAWYRPLAFEGVVFSLNKQQLRGAFGDGENNGVNGHHRSWPVVNVFAFFIHVKNFS